MWDPHHDTPERETDFSSFPRMTPVDPGRLGEIEHSIHIHFLGLGGAVFGRKLYGVVDVVPGRFYVATAFYHFYYFPLLPVQSYVLYESSDPEEEYFGAPMELRWKSVLFGYLRPLLVCGGVLAALGGIISISTNEQLTFLGLVALCVVGWLVLKWGRRASADQAAHLATTLGWSESEVVRLQEDLWFPGTSVESTDRSSAQNQ